MWCWSRLAISKITSKMTTFSATFFGFAILLILNGNATDAGRIARSPQFGGFSQAQASASAGGFGGGFGPYRPNFRPPGPPGPPGFGHGGFGQGGSGQGGLGQGGYGQGGFGPASLNQGGSISISKSISISRGGASQSSAQSSATGK